MKMNILISLLVVAMVVMAFVSCEKPEPIEVSQIVVNQEDITSVTHNTELSYTDCHSHQSKGYYDPIIIPNYDNGVFYKQRLIERLK